MQVFFISNGVEGERGEKRTVRRFKERNIFIPLTLILGGEYIYYAKNLGMMLPVIIQIVS